MRNNKPCTVCSHVSQLRRQIYDHLFFKLDLALNQHVCDLELKMKVRFRPCRSNMLIFCDQLTFRSFRQCATMFSLSYTLKLKRETPHATSKTFFSTIVVNYKGSTTTTVSGCAGNTHTQLRRNGFLKFRQTPPDFSILSS